MQLRPEDLWHISLTMVLPSRKKKKFQWLPLPTNVHSLRGSWHGHSLVYFPASPPTLPQYEPSAESSRLLPFHACVLAVSCALDVLSSIKPCDRLELGAFGGRRIT